jgi:hypothetical protein
MREHLYVVKLCIFSQIYLEGGGEVYYPKGKEGKNAGLYYKNNV